MEITHTPIFRYLCILFDAEPFSLFSKKKSFSSGIKESIEKTKTSKSKKLIAREITYNEFLEDQFKRLFSSYALAFNKQESRTGSLFQKRFKRVGVVNNSKLLKLLAYIQAS